MFNLTVAIHKKNWNLVRALQHLVFKILNYIGFDNGVCEFGPLLFFLKKTSPSDTLSICVVVLQENGAEVPGGVSR